MDWKLSLAGLLIGLLVGMTGMGGGSLMTPRLVLVFGCANIAAVAAGTVFFRWLGSRGAVAAPEVDVP